MTGQARAQPQIATEIRQCWVRREQSSNELVIIDQDVNGCRSKDGLHQVIGMSDRLFRKNNRMGSQSSRSSTAQSLSRVHELMDRSCFHVTDCCEIARLSPTTTTSNSTMSRSHNQLLVEEQQRSITQSPKDYDHTGLMTVKHRHTFTRRVDSTQSGHEGGRLYIQRGTDGYDDQNTDHNSVYCNYPRPNHHHRSNQHDYRTLQHRASTDSTLLSSIPTPIDMSVSPRSSQDADSSPRITIISDVVVIDSSPTIASSSRSPRKVECQEEVTRHSSTSPSCSKRLNEGDLDKDHLHEGQSGGKRRGRRLTTEDKMVARKNEQERVQKKTFTKWLNHHLSKASTPIVIEELYKDLSDGTVLLQALQILGKTKLSIETRANMKRVHSLTNVKNALDYLASRKVKLVNINPTDVVDGKPTIVLGLIWCIILHFQIEEHDESLRRMLGLPSSAGPESAKHLLKNWVQEAVNGSLPVPVDDFGPSWRDGHAFNAMVHRIDPRLVDLSTLNGKSSRENLDHAFCQAEQHLGIPQLLDPDDIDVDRPDEKSIMTYVAEFFKAYPEAGAQRQEQSESISDPQSLPDLIQRLHELDAIAGTYLNGTRYSLNEHVNTYQDTADKSRRLHQLLLEIQQHEQPTETSSSFGDVDQVDLEIAEENWESLASKLDKWRWLIDDKLTSTEGELAPIARWISRAEQWLAKVRGEWYRKADQTHAYVFTSTTTDSTFTASCNDCLSSTKAEPPNSPPPLPDLQALVGERESIFGPDNKQGHSMATQLENLDRDRISIDNLEDGTKQNFLQSMTDRVQLAIGQFPSHSTVLEAGMARRRLLDLLFATKFSDSDEGLTIRVHQHRRTSPRQGLEYNLAQWLRLAGMMDRVGEAQQTCVSIVSPDQLNDLLLEFEYYINTERLPDRLNECLSQLELHYSSLCHQSNLLTPQALQSPSWQSYDVSGRTDNSVIIPENALEIVLQWLDASRACWNADKKTCIDRLGDWLTDSKRQLDQCEGLHDKIEDTLEEVESLAKSGSQVQPLLDQLEQYFDQLDNLCQHTRISFDRDHSSEARSRLDRIKQKIAERETTERYFTDRRNKLDACLDEVHGWLSEVNNPGRYQFDHSRSPSPVSRQGHLVTLTCNQVDNYLTRLLNKGLELLQQKLNIDDQIETAKSLIADWPSNMPDMTSRIRLVESKVNEACTSLNEENNVIGQLHTGLIGMNKVLDLLESKWTTDMTHSMDHTKKHEELDKASEQLTHLHTLLGSDCANKLDPQLTSYLIGMEERIEKLKNSLVKFEHETKQRQSAWQALFDQLTVVERGCEEIDSKLKENKASIKRTLPDELTSLYPLFSILRDRHHEVSDKSESIKYKMRDLIGRFGDGQLADEARHRYEKINHRLDDLGSNMISLENDLQRKIDEFKQDQIELTSQLEWLTSIENQLNLLSQGPESGPANLKCKAEAYSVWHGVCEEFNTTITGQLKSFQDRVRPLIDNLDKMTLIRDRCRLVEANSKKLTRYTTQLSKAVSQVDSSLTSAQSWLDHNSTCPDSGNFDCYQLKSLVETEGNQLLEEVKAGIERLVDLVTSSSTPTLTTQSISPAPILLTDVVLIARRELGEFQTRLGQINRQFELACCRADSIASNRSKLSHDLMEAEQWVAKLCSDLRELSTDANWSSSLNQVACCLQNLIKSLNQLDAECHQRGREYDQRLTNQVTSLTSDSHDRIEQWRQQWNDVSSSIDTLKQDQMRRLTSIEQLIAKVNQLGKEVAKVERDKAECKTKSQLIKASENWESHVQKCQELIQNLQSKQDYYFKAIDHLCEEYQGLVGIKCRAFSQSELDSLRSRVEQIFTNLPTEQSKLTTTSQVLTNAHEVSQGIDSILAEIEDKIDDILSRHPCNLELSRSIDDDYHALDVIVSCENTKLDELSDTGKQFFAPNSTLDQLTVKLHDELQSLVKLQSPLTGEIQRLINKATQNIGLNRERTTTALTRQEFLIKSLVNLTTCCHEAVNFLDGLEANDRKEHEGEYLGDDFEHQPKSSHVIGRLQGLLQSINCDSSLIRSGLVEAQRSVLTNIDELVAISNTVTNAKRSYNTVKQIPANFDTRLEQIRSQVNDSISRFQQIVKREIHIASELDSIKTALSTLCARLDSDLERIRGKVDVFELDYAQGRPGSLQSPESELEKLTIRLRILEDQIDRMGHPTVLEHRLHALKSCELQRVNKSLECYSTQVERYSTLWADWQQAVDQYTSCLDVAIDDVDRGVSSCDFASLDEWIEVHEKRISESEFEHQIACLLLTKLAGQSRFTLDQLEFSTQSGQLADTVISTGSQFASVKSHPRWIQVLTKTEQYKTCVISTLNKLKSPIDQVKCWLTEVGSVKDQLGAIETKFNSPNNNTGNELRNFHCTELTNVDQALNGLKSLSTLLIEGSRCWSDFPVETVNDEMTLLCSRFASIESRNIIGDGGGGDKRPIQLIYDTDAQEQDLDHWLTQFSSDLDGLEQRVTGLKFDRCIESHVELYNHIVSLVNDLNKLKEKGCTGRKKLDNLESLSSKCQQDKVDLDAAEKRLTALTVTRLNCLTELIEQVKCDLDKYTSGVEQTEFELSSLEVKCDRLAGQQYCCPTRSDWLALSGEIEQFKDTSLDNLTRLERDALLDSCYSRQSTLASSQFHARVDVLLDRVRCNVNQLRQAEICQSKAKSLSTVFSQSLVEIRQRFEHLTHCDILPSSSQMQSSSRHGLGQFCDLLVRNLDRSNALLANLQVRVNTDMTEQWKVLKETQPSDTNEDNESLRREWQRLSCQLNELEVGIRRTRKEMSQTCQAYADCSRTLAKYDDQSQNVDNQLNCQLEQTFARSIDSPRVWWYCHEGQDESLSLPSLSCIQNEQHDNGNKMKDVVSIVNSACERQAQILSCLQQDMSCFEMLVYQTVPKAFQSVSSLTTNCELGRELRLVSQRLTEQEIEEKDQSIECVNQRVAWCQTGLKALDRLIDGISAFDCWSIDFLNQLASAHQQLMQAEGSNLDEECIGFNRLANLLDLGKKRLDNLVDQNIRDEGIADPTKHQLDRLVAIHQRCLQLYQQALDQVDRVKQRNVEARRQLESCMADSEDGRSRLEQLKRSIAQQIGQCIESGDWTTPRHDQLICRLLVKVATLHKELTGKVEQQSETVDQLTSLLPNQTASIKDCDKAAKQHALLAGELKRYLVRLRKQMNETNGEFNQLTSWLKQTEDRLVKLEEPSLEVCGHLQSETAGQECVNDLITCLPCGISLSNHELSSSSLVRHQVDHFKQISQWACQVEAKYKQLLPSLNESVQQLCATLSLLCINVDPVNDQSNQVESRSCELINRIGQLKEKAKSNILLAVEFEREFGSWFNDYTGMMCQLKEALQCSIVSVDQDVDLSVDPDHEMAQVDLVGPLNGLLHKFHKLHSELTSLRERMLRLGKLMQTLQESSIIQSSLQPSQHQFDRVKTQLCELDTRFKETSCLLQKTFKEKQSYHRLLTEIRLSVEACSQRLTELTCSIDQDECNLSSNLESVMKVADQLRTLQCKVADQMPCRLESLSRVSFDCACKISQLANSTLLDPIQFSDSTNNLPTLIDCLTGLSSPTSPWVTSSRERSRTLPRQHNDHRRLGHRSASDQDVACCRTSTAGHLADQGVISRARKRVGLIEQRLTCLTNQANELIKRLQRSRQAEQQNKARRDQLAVWLTECETQFRRLESPGYSSCYSRCGLATSPYLLPSSSQPTWTWTSYVDEHKTLFSCLQSRREEVEQARKTKCIHSRDRESLDLGRTEDNGEPSLFKRFHCLSQKVQARIGWLTYINSQIDRFHTIKHQIEAWIVEVKCVIDSNKTCSSDLELIDLEQKGSRLLESLFESLHCLIHQTSQDVQQYRPSSSSSYQLCTLGSLCDSRMQSSTPLNCSRTISELSCLAEASKHPLIGMSLELVQQGNELTSTFERLKCVMEIFKTRNNERAEQLRAYADLLHRIGDFLDQELQQWWSCEKTRGSSNDDHSNDLVFVTNSTDDAAGQLKSTAEMQDRVKVMLKELQSAEGRCGIRFDHEREILCDLGNEFASIEQSASKVHCGLRREFHKLESRLGQLKSLQRRWQSYEDDRGALRRWLDDRETTLQRLVQLKPSSCLTKEANRLDLEEEGRNLEDFVELLQKRRRSFSALDNTYKQLTRNSQNGDPQLDALLVDYRRLLRGAERQLTRLGLPVNRFREKSTTQDQRLKSRMRTASSVQNLDSVGKKPSFNSKSRYDSALYRLAKSVHALKDELACEESSAYRSRHPCSRNNRAYQPVQSHETNQPKHLTMTAKHNRSASACPGDSLRYGSPSHLYEANADPYPSYSKVRRPCGEISRQQHNRQYCSTIPHSSSVLGDQCYRQVSPIASRLSCEGRRRRYESESSSLQSMTPLVADIYRRTSQLLASKLPLLTSPPNRQPRCPNWTAAGESDKLSLYGKVGGSHTLLNVTEHSPNPRANRAIDGDKTSRRRTLSSSHSPCLPFHQQRPSATKTTSSAYHGITPSKAMGYIGETGHLPPLQSSSFTRRPITDLAGSCFALRREGSATDNLVGSSSTFDSSQLYLSRHMSSSGSLTRTNTKSNRNWLGHPKNHVAVSPSHVVEMTHYSDSVIQSTHGDAFEQERSTIPNRVESDGGDHENFLKNPNGLKRDEGPDHESTLKNLSGLKRGYGLNAETLSSNGYQMSSTYSDDLDNQFNGDEPTLDKLERLEHRYGLDRIPGIAKPDQNVRQWLRSPFDSNEDFPYRTKLLNFLNKLAEGTGLQKPKNRNWMDDKTIGHPNKRESRYAAKHSRLESVEQIIDELSNPFASKNLNHETLKRLPPLLKPISIVDSKPDPTKCRRTRIKHRRSELGINILEHDCNNLKRKDSRDRLLGISNQQYLPDSGYISSPHSSPTRPIDRSIPATNGIYKQQVPEFSNSMTKKLVNSLNAENIIEFSEKQVSNPIDGYRGQPIVSEESLNDTDLKFRSFRSISDIRLRETNCVRHHESNHPMDAIDKIRSRLSSLSRNNGDSGRILPNDPDEIKACENRAHNLLGLQSESKSIVNSHKDKTSSIVEQANDCGARNNINRREPSKYSPDQIKEELDRSKTDVLIERVNNDCQLMNKHSNSPYSDENSKCIELQQSFHQKEFENAETFGNAPINDDVESRSVSIKNSPIVMDRKDANSLYTVEQLDEQVKREDPDLSTYDDKISPDCLDQTLNHSSTVVLVDRIVNELTQTSRNGTTQSVNYVKVASKIPIRQNRETNKKTTNHQYQQQPLGSDSPRIVDRRSRTTNAGIPVISARSRSLSRKPILLFRYCRRNSIDSVHVCSCKLNVNHVGLDPKLQSLRSMPDLRSNRSPLLPNPPTVSLRQLSDEALYKLSYRSMDAINGIRSDPSVKNVHRSLDNSTDSSNYVHMKRGYRNQETSPLDHRSGLNSKITSNNYQISTYERNRNPSNDCLRIGLDRIQRRPSQRIKLTKSCDTLIPIDERVNDCDVEKNISYNNCQDTSEFRFNQIESEIDRSKTDVLIERVNNDCQLMNKHSNSPYSDENSKCIELQQSFHQKEFENAETFGNAPINDDVESRSVSIKNSPIVMDRKDANSLYTVEQLDEQVKREDPDLSTYDDKISPDCLDQTLNHSSTVVLVDRIVNELTQTSRNGTTQSVNYVKVASKIPIRQNRETNKKTTNHQYQQQPLGSDSPRIVDRRSRTTNAGIPVISARSRSLSRKPILLFRYCRRNSIDSVHVCSCKLNVNHVGLDPKLQSLRSMPDLRSNRSPLLPNPPTVSLRQLSDEALYKLSYRSMDAINGIRSDPSVKNVHRSLDNSTDSSNYVHMKRGYRNQETSPLDHRSGLNSKITSNNYQISTYERNRNPSNDCLRIGLDRIQRRPSQRIKLTKSCDTLIPIDERVNDCDVENHCPKDFNNAELKDNKFNHANIEPKDPHLTTKLVKKVRMKTLNNTNNESDNGGIKMRDELMSNSMNEKYREEINSLHKHELLEKQMKCTGLTSSTSKNNKIVPQWPNNQLLWRTRTTCSIRDWNHSSTAEKDQSRGKKLKQCIANGKVLRIPIQQTVEKAPDRLQFKLTTPNFASSIVGGRPPLLPIVGNPSRHTGPRSILNQPTRWCQPTPVGNYPSRECQTTTSQFRPIRTLDWETQLSGWGLHSTSRSRNKPSRGTTPHSFGDRV